MSKTPDADRLRRLTRFIPKFQKYTEPEQEFGTVVVDDALYAEYPEVLDSFLSQLRQDDWLEAPYSGEEGQRYRENPERLEEADFETLQRLLVYCTRGERFSTGFWKRVVESGFLLGILRRLQVIHHSLDDGSGQE